MQQIKLSVIQHSCWTEVELKRTLSRKTHLAAGAVIAYVLFSAALLAPGDSIVGSPYYLIGSVGMFLSMLWIMRHWHGRRMLAAVLLLAVLVRIVAIFQFPENSDLNRYIWEGEIQLAGYNPYLLPPESEKLKHLRNENWHDVNFKNIPAIYWPFAQMLFKLGAAISPSHNFFKAILVVFDLATMFVLLLILHPVTRDYREIALYALNPLAIISVSGEGHLESVLVFWIMLSIYGLRQKKPWLMYLSLGLASMTKLTPVIFLPLIVERGNLKSFPLFLLPFGLMVPYYDPGLDFLSTLDIFLSSFNHNGIFYYVSVSLTGVLPTDEVAMLIAASLCGFVFFLTPDRTRAVFLVSALLLVFAPTFHTWYLLMVTPFIVLYRSPPWIILHLTMLPLVFFFHPLATHPFWHDKPLLQAIEFFPFFAASLWCFWKSRQYWPARFPQPGSVSVVITAGQPGRNPADALQSVENNNGCPLEIIVVGSNPDIAANSPDVDFLPCAGRNPYTCALLAAQHDVIVLLPAGARLLPGAFSRMMKALGENESAVGGHFGLAGDHPGPGARWRRMSALLKRIWILASGISSGGQARFFRRGAFPFSLPEDMTEIELSLRMKESGAMVFIPESVAEADLRQACARSWTGSAKLICKTMCFLTLRRLGFPARDNDDGHPDMPTDPAKKQAA